MIPRSIVSLFNILVYLNQCIRIPHAMWISRRSCAPLRIYRLLLPSYFYSALISSRSRREQRLKSHTIHEKQYPRCLYVISDTLNPFLLVSHCTTQIYIYLLLLLLLFILILHSLFLFFSALLLRSSRESFQRRGASRLVERLVTIGRSAGYRKPL